MMAFTWMCWQAAMIAITVVDSAQPTAMEKIKIRSRQPPPTVAEVLASLKLRGEMQTSDGWTMVEADGMDSGNYTLIKGPQPGTTAPSSLPPDFTVSPNLNNRVFGIFVLKPSSLLQYSQCHILCSQPSIFYTHSNSVQRSSVSPYELPLSLEDIGNWCESEAQTKSWLDSQACCCAGNVLIWQCLNLIM